MAPMRSVVVGLALLGLGLNGARAAGPSPPGAASPTRSWIDDWDLPGTRAVYVQNLSDRPVRVASFRLSDCRNVGLVECEVDTAIDRLIAPGETIALVVVSPVLTTSGNPPRATFRYTYAVRLP